MEQESGVRCQASGMRVRSNGFYTSLFGRANTRLPRCGRIRRRTGKCYAKDEKAGQGANLRCFRIGIVDWLLLSYSVCGARAGRVGRVCGRLPLQSESSLGLLTGLPRGAGVPQRKGGIAVKIIVFDSPRILKGLLRAIFKMKKPETR